MPTGLSPEKDSSMILSRNLPETFTGILAGSISEHTLATTPDIFPALSLYKASLAISPECCP